MYMVPLGWMVGRLLKVIPNYRTFLRPRNIPDPVESAGCRYQIESRRESVGE